MSANLVIVESPAKAKTIQKFLGKSYKVIASNGHVRDLPKSTLGIDVENDFEPKYITIRGKGDILAQLRKEVKKASITCTSCNGFPQENSCICTLPFLRTSAFR